MGFLERVHHHRGHFASRVRGPEPATQRIWRGAAGSGLGWCGLVASARDSGCGRGWVWGTRRSEAGLEVGWGEWGWAVPWVPAVVWENVGWSEFPGTALGLGWGWVVSECSGHRSAAGGGGGGVGVLGVQAPTRMARAAPLPGWPPGTGSWSFPITAGGKDGCRRTPVMENCQGRGR